MKSRAQLGTGTHDALRPACPTSSAFLSRYSTLLDVQKTQPPTSYCVMSGYQIWIAYFVTYNNIK